MKVLLIRPPVHSFMNVIAFNADRCYPVGLLYLASVLRRAGHQCVVFDSWAFGEDNHSGWSESSLSTASASASWRPARPPVKVDR